jgi:HEAT repeat protein
VRRWVVEAVAWFPSLEHVGTLISVVNDPHPGLRVRSREVLLDFSGRDELTKAVIDGAVQVLHGDDWRGQEQALRILGILDHEPAADRFLELLHHERGEVYVTAAWGIRKLSIPETLPAVFEFASHRTEVAMGNIEDGTFSNEWDPLLSQLYQLFGVLRYQPAEPLMRRCVPKFALSDEARAAAIWTLGYLHEGTGGPPDLVKQLEGRLKDVQSSPAEVDRVRQLCAIALGRMKAESALPTLREMFDFDSPNSYVGAAESWAIHHMTGEEMPEGDVVRRNVQGWFLLPAD